MQKLKKYQYGKTTKNQCGKNYKKINMQKLKKKKRYGKTTKKSTWGKLRKNQQGKTLKKSIWKNYKNYQ